MCPLNYILTHHLIKVGKYKLKDISEQILRIYCMELEIVQSYKASFNMKYRAQLSQASLSSSGEALASPFAFIIICVLEL